MVTFLPARTACALSCGLARFSSALTVPKTRDRTRLSERARPTDLMARSIRATGPEIKSARASTAERRSGLLGHLEAPVHDVPVDVLEEGVDVLRRRRA